MNALAIDTATESLSVAVEYNRADRRARMLRVHDEGLRHAERLIPLIRAMLDEAGLLPSQLECVMCAAGPGSFTGLRIGMATAKGFAAAADIPVISVPTLDAVAYPYGFYPGLIVAALDARKGRYYAAAYRAAARITPALDVTGEELLERLRALREPEERYPVLVVGRDAPEAASMLQEHLHVTVAPAHRAAIAMSLLELGLIRLREGNVDPEDAGPIYLRASDAELHRSRGGRREGAGKRER